MQYMSNQLEPVYEFFVRRKKLSMLLGALLLCVGLLLCWKVGVRHEAPDAVVPAEIPASEEDMVRDFPRLVLSEQDLDDELDQAEKVNLSNKLGGYQINRGGSYRLTGEMEGTLTIRAPEERVHLFLDDVTITSNSGSAIHCVDADKLTITMLPGTKNMISDSGDYRDTPDLEACVFAACDLTINGAGALTVNGYYKDAIRSRDVLKITGGTYEIKCKRTALHGTDGIHVSDGKFTISTEKNGMKTSKGGEDGRGTLMVSGGEFAIIAGEYAFTTVKANIYVFNCTVRNRSIISTFHSGGTYFVKEGCVS